MLMATTWFGTFLLEGKQVVDSRLFPKDAKAIAHRLRSIEAGAVLEEEKALAACGKRFSVHDARLRALGELSEAMPPALDGMASKMGYTPELLHEATMLVGREKLGELGPDRFVVQAIAGLDELTKSANLLTERLMEWYGLHFPELVESVPQAELVELVSRHGSREGIQKGAGKAMESFGTPLSAEDEKAVKEWASLVRNLAETRGALEGYVTRRMEELAPNLSSVVGPLLAARLLSLTGSLERLGRLPASTMQLLGAEKALFQFMKEGGRPPKHGVLFQHPMIHRAPPWQRGKLARALASAASLAARTDSFSKRDLAETINAGLQKKVQRIQRENASPPDRRDARPPQGARSFDFKRAGRRRGGR
jgi:nucleolar protein 56